MVCGGWIVVGGDFSFLVVLWILVYGVVGGDCGFWMVCFCFIYIDIYVSVGVLFWKNKQEDQIYSNIIYQCLVYLRCFCGEIKGDIEF